jgi:hypothetical protein
MIKRIIRFFRDWGKAKSRQVRRANERRQLKIGGR